MDKSKRKAIIAGNWKMNKTPKEAKELLNAITPLVKDAGCEVIACVPYVDLATALEATEGTMLKSVQKTVTGLKAVLSLAKSQQVCSRKWALNM